MSKEITVSDEVYRKLKQEKGDRSFSEVIADRLEVTHRLCQVTGQEILEESVIDTTRDDINRLSDATLTRLDDENP